MILPNIDKVGAFAVVNKVQNLLTEKLIIRAGVARISDKQFERLEKEAYAALSEACQSNETVVFLEEKVKTLDEWLSDEEKNEKNFKLFQNAYNNKSQNDVKTLRTEMANAGIVIKYYEDNYKDLYE